MARRQDPDVVLFKLDQGLAELEKNVMKLRQEVQSLRGQDFGRRLKEKLKDAGEDSHPHRRIPKRDP